MKRHRAAVAASLIAVAGEAGAAETIAPPNLPSPDTWVPTAGGSIRVLDKQKAASELLTLRLNQPIQFETLSITLRACMVHPPALPADAAGFLEIVDSRESEPGFHGWMLANEPGVAMLESPVYGVRIAGCDKPTQAAIDAVMPPPPPKPALPARSTDQDLAAPPQAQDLDNAVPSAPPLAAPPQPALPQPALPRTDQGADQPAPEQPPD